jgi:transposase
MGKNRNIQGQKGCRFSEELRGVSLDQILVVPIDAAKYHPKALICNYFGDILEDSFFFSVNSAGLDELSTKIHQCAKACKATRILIGIEATGHYHEDIVRELEKRGFQVTIINAYTTSEERTSSLNWTKTDDIDLAAIAVAIRHNKGTESKLPNGIYDKLLTATRARRSEVNKHSALQIEIRNLMDVIWSGFQAITEVRNGKAETKPIFSDFWGNAPVFLMRHYPEPKQILALGSEGLNRLSKEHRLKMRSHTIEKLLYAAEMAFNKSSDELEVELMLLPMKLDQLDQINKNVRILEQKIEKLLVQTPGVLLLSLPEIGLVTAAEFTAEAGPIEQYTNSRQIIKKAGTNPLVSQTGGGAPSYGRISKQGNPWFRTVIYSIGFNLANGKTNPYFKMFAQRLKANGKKGRQIWIATGNKFIKVAFALLRNKRLFNPPLWNGLPLTKDVVSKIKAKANKDVAQKTLDNLLKLNLTEDFRAS